MAKGKKKKIKKKKTAPERSSRAKKSARKAKPKAIKKKKAVKPKKTVKAKAVSKKLKLVPKKEKISKKEEKKLKGKEKPVVTTEIIAPKTETAPVVPKGPSPKAIARAKAALAAKEKAKIPALPIDKAAADKQLKLAEPKNKLELEYIINASPVLLYEFI